jgi:hypothetical protein
MKGFLIAVVVVAGLPGALAQAQSGGHDPEQPASVAARAEVGEEQARSAGRAFLLSWAVPGLGHRYAYGGSWRGAATGFALADAALWASLVGLEWRQSHLVESYRTLAASRAGALVEGKDRTFFLYLASFRSSDEYLDVQLRNRAWDQVGYVSERTNQWSWVAEEDFHRFQMLREDAESLRRRRPFLIAMLVANRLTAGLTSIRAVHRANAQPADVSMSFHPAPDGAKYPMVRMTARW